MRIVAGSDLFVLASHHEGFPVAVMEALTAGVPVVSTAVGDVPDAVGKGGGLVVPPGDAAALADALRALIVDPSRRRHMAEAARAVGSQFDIRPASARLEEIYDTLLSAGVQTSSVLRRDRPPATPGT
jgi:glycosyltransferase involved in cell wall biosynthesis